MKRTTRRTYRKIIKTPERGQQVKSLVGKAITLLALGAAFQLLAIECLLRNT